MAVILLIALQGCVVLFILWQLTQSHLVRNSQNTVDLLRVCLLLSLIPSYYFAKSFCAARKSMPQKVLVFILVFATGPFIIDWNSISMISRYVITGLSSVGD